MKIELEGQDGLVITEPPIVEKSKDEQKGFSVLKSIFWRKPAVTDSVVVEPPPPEPLQRRHEIDLKPYGFDIVFDFNWSRQ